MCGIYVTNIPYSKEEVESKLKTIYFRGPNNMGIEKIDEVTLGHLRLSILDLEKRSNQPYNFGKYTIVYNGEIYNYKQIQSELVSEGYHFETTSDTEVLIKGFDCWGKEILKKLNGMFAFAIYNTESKQLFCARDRVGVKPFYYFWKEGKFEICSQLRPLFSKELTVSKEAIAIYLDCGYIPSPYTIFEEVYKLSPGHYMLIDTIEKTKVIETYWDLQPVTLTNMSYAEAKDKLHELIKDAVKIRMQSDVPLGSFLSGGIDSALVSAIAAKISDKPINTFTIASEDPQYDESKVAKQYAALIGSHHRETTCKPKQFLEMLKDFRRAYDEPFADSSALPSLLLNKITKQEVTVALSGDGGDESFIGYSHFVIIDKFRKLSWVPYPIRKLLSKVPFHWFTGSMPHTIREILNSKDENELAVKFYISLDTINKKRDLRWLDKHYSSFKYLSKDALQRAADLNIKLWLENDSNVKVDRASMAFSVESRSPFLDYRIMEFARALPISYRYKDGITKRILKDILEEYIPREVFTQPKKGFSIPLEKWLRNELKADVLQKLNDSFLYSVPNLDVEKFKKELSLHFQGKRNYVFNIWKVYVLALWCEEFGISLQK